MIDFEQYLVLKRRSQNGLLSIDDQRKAVQFVAAQPPVCPKCKGQVFSPFLLLDVLHDVSACRGISVITGRRSVAAS